MKFGSTLFLKVVTLMIGLIVLLVCIFVLPSGIRAEDAGGYRPILIGMYIPAIPFFIALYQSLKLLSYIDNNKAFSHASVKALNKIKYCGLVISGLYALGMPYIFLVAEQDDAPGVVLIGLIFTFAPLIVAIIAAVLQRLLQNAIEIKSENEQAI